MAADAAPGLVVLPEIPGVGARVTLEGAEAHYLARVCRARAGDLAEATDGRGARARLRVLEAAPRVVAEVEWLRHEPRAREAWMLCGAPEGERGDWLVEKLAELGIARLVPVEAARATWRKAAGRAARWERLAVAALRQSRRAHLMEVAEPIALGPALASLPEGPRWLADREGEALAGSPDLGGGWCACLVGPSPGLEPEERARVLAAGFRPVRLADARLRTETAALAWASWWSATGASPRPGSR